MGRIATVVQIEVEVGKELDIDEIVDDDEDDEEGSLISFGSPGSKIALVVGKLASRIRTDNQENRLENVFELDLNDSGSDGGR